VTGPSGVAVWKALRSVKGMGPTRLTEIALRLNQQGLTLEEAWHDPNEPLLDVVRSALGQAIENESRGEELPSGVEVLTPETDSYPRERLNPRLPLSPVLYVFGNASLLSAPGVAVSGSRRSSPAALRYVKTLVQVLTSNGMNVVSGHAAGVDEVAHVTALATGGTTTIVAAEGLGQFKAKKSLSLVDEASFVVVSEFEPAERWTAFRAMKRNSTIAALADAVVVVAAGRSGGAWAQAELSLRAKKTVLVPDVHSPDAEGNQELIQMGAVPLDPSRPAEVMDYLIESPRDTEVDAKQLNMLDI
jgi:DNA processing protein